MSPDEMGEVRPVSQFDRILVAFGKSMLFVASAAMGLGMAVMLLFPAAAAALTGRPKDPLEWALLTAAWLGWGWSLPWVFRLIETLSYGLRRAAWRTWPRLSEGRHRESVRTCTILAVLPVAAILAAVAFLPWLALAGAARALVLWAAAGS